MYVSLGKIQSASINILLLIITSVIGSGGYKQAGNKYFEDKQKIKAFKAQTASSYLTNCTFVFVLASCVICPSNITIQPEFSPVSLGFCVILSLSLLTAGYLVTFKFIYY